MADDLLLEFRGQHALHRGLDLVDAVVDDAVHTDLHVGADGAVSGGVVRADVEADDDRAGGGGKHDVGLVDRADGGVDDADADFLVGELLERRLDRLGAALDVGLDDDVEVLDLALVDACEQILERDLLGGAGIRGHFGLLLAFLHKLTRHAFVVDGVEDVARVRYLAHAGDLHRYGRAGLLDALALVADHRADAADGRAGDDDIALMQGAVLDENGHDRAAALVQPCLDDGAGRGAVRVGAQAEHLGLEGEHLKQLVDAVAGLRGDRNHDRIAAPLLGDQLVFGELLLDLLGVRAGHIHLVDGDDDGDVRGLGVVDGFDRLRLDALGRGDDEDGDVGHHRAAGAHGGKRLVARGVEEGDRRAVDLHDVRADGLRDAAGLTGRDVGVADIVEKRGLAVVDVAHDDDDRGAGLQLGVGIDVVVNQPLLDRDDDLVLYLAAHLHGDKSGGVVVDGVGQARHDAHLDETAHDLGAGLLHADGQLLHGDLVRYLHAGGRLLRDLELEALHLFALLLPALRGGGHLVLALLVFVADLLLAPAALLGLVAGHAVEAFVVFGEIRVGGAAGVDDLLLRHLLRNMGLVGLRLAALLRILLRLLRGLLFGGLRGLLGLPVLLLILSAGGGVGLPGGGLPGGGGIPRFGFRSVLFPFRLLRLFRIGEYLRDASDLVVLGHVFEDDAQLLILQHLHVVLRRRCVLRQDLRDHLGGDAEILCDLMHAVFHQAAHIRSSCLRSICCRGGKRGREALVGDKGDSHRSCPPGCGGKL